MGIAKGTEFSASSTKRFKDPIGKGLYVKNLQKEEINLNQPKFRRFETVVL